MYQSKSDFGIFELATLYFCRATKVICIWAICRLVPISLSKFFIPAVHIAVFPLTGDAVRWVAYYD